MHACASQSGGVRARKESGITNPNDQNGKDRGWRAIFDQYKIGDHDFDAAPFPISAKQIKTACQHFHTTGEKEVRVLCMQTTREMRPSVFEENGLFILPVRNGEYVIIRGEGYLDIPRVAGAIINYSSKLDFPLQSSFVGNSEMQHLDYAYAVSMVRDFVGDPSLVPTIRGRKYTPEFSFRVGGFNINVRGVQTEVDIGYEGRDRIVLVEAKNSATRNTIIRQLYYPFRQWQIKVGKKISTVFFEKQESGEYHFWEFVFSDEADYNSIRLVKSARYQVSE